MEWLQNTFQENSLLLILTIVLALSWIFMLKGMLKKSEDASSRAIQDLLERSQDLFFAYEPDGKMKSCNQAMVDLTGYKTAEFLKLNIDRWAAPEHKNRVQSLPAQLIEKKGMISHELNVFTKDQKRIRLEIWSHPVLQGGNLSLIQNLARASADGGKSSKRSQERKEKLLEISQEISRNLIQCDDSGIHEMVEVSIDLILKSCQFDRFTLFLIEGSKDQILRTVEKQSKEAANYKQSSIVPFRQVPWLSGRMLKGDQFSVLNVDDLPVEAISDQQYLKSRSTISGVYAPVFRNENPIAYIELSKRSTTAALSDWTQSEMGIISNLGLIIKTALDRVHHQSDREMRETLLETMNDTAPVAFYVAHRQTGQILYFNHRFCEIWRMEHLAGQMFRGELRHQETIKRCQGYLSKEEDWPSIVTEQKSLSWYQEKEAPLKDGRTVRCLASEVREIESNEYLGDLYMFEDVTDRLSLSEQLRQSQKMESVGQLAAGVAHDFNNILTIIHGHTGMLIAKKQLQAEIIDPVQQIADAATRATELTRQLLAFSRKQEMRPKTLDLNDVIHKLSKMLKRVVFGFSIDIDFEYGSELACVEGDTGMIEQILLNLTVNARDAMDGGGKLKIRTCLKEIDAAHAARIPDAKAGSFICLAVTDTGCGMSAETQRKIFEPFFTTKGPGKGTGLGLSTVYGIVKQHQGWLEVDSELGKGTTFSVLLPASSNALEKVVVEEAVSAVSLAGSETILILEDELILLELAQDILREYGYTMLPATSSEEALEIWKDKSNEVDLLLTDIVMPSGLSGRELAEKLVQEKPSLKVIFASGYTAETAIEGLTLEEGLNFLAKPYTPQHLIKTVRNRLETPV